jgi:hypothetical protein
MLGTEDNTNAFQTIVRTEHLATTYSSTCQLCLQVTEPYKVFIEQSHRSEGKVLDTEDQTNALKTIVRTEDLVMP